MLPPPPGLLLTDNVALIRRRSWTTFSMVRAVLSLLPPGADGTISSTFLLGCQLCASAGPANTINANHAISRLSMRASSVSVWARVPRAQLQNPGHRAGLL